MQNKLEQALEPYHLRVRHLELLVCIEAMGPVSQGAAAEALFINKSTIVPIIDDLEAGELLERSRDPQDRRGNHLTLTAGGIETLATVMAEIHELESDWFKTLDVNERSEFEALLSRLPDDLGNRIGLAKTMPGIRSTGVNLHNALRLAVSGRVIHEKFERALESAGLRARHFGLLVCLSLLGPLTQGEAARRMSIDKSTIVSIVDDLEKARWGERRRSEIDRRAHILHLTREGAAKLAEALSAISDFEKSWLSMLSPGEHQRLQWFLHRLLHGPNGWLA